jgi:GT2 family glycosyltransferase
MEVSIIIVNYNTSVLIKNLLRTIEKKTEGISYEVIVVDNNPTEQFAVDIKDYLDRIIYLPLKENVGFGRANNEGLKIANGRNIFFLNPDTLLVNNAIKILSDYLDENENVGVCGGNLYDKDMNPIHSFIRMLPSPIWDLNSLLGNLIFKSLYGKDIQFNYTGKPLSVGYVTGADMMVKRSVLDAVGNFDSDFFMYYEETELSYRITEAGYDIVSIPNAKIIHLEGQSFIIKEERIKKIIHSLKIYDKKTIKNKFYLSLCNFIRILNCRCRIIIFRIIHNQDKLLFWKYWLKYYKD